ncbi:leucyl/phenylalanyl-tRNA--protein transferase [Moellerella wisconsensis]|uniref:Leucyl/phenylalanyl-tRNA--protein transferase n=1 Tax=Moellerella wisconsensis TaxID=158849 RepID=A0ACD3YAF4_9GAMM|nr:leucyl/phenylalanyl-tRNA--protein transferase [Moellerella wisconsensis]UNH39729.1 leucyl/phenylalanyl-tRNA--protein transferase [Moellerella wisconsensis]
MFKLDDDNVQFPPIELAMREPNGLLAMGGNLSPERLKASYYQGIFPWFSPNELPLWWSPDPRAVLLPNELHISRSMKKLIKQRPFTISLNKAFDEVIDACAIRTEGTWIVPEVRAGYKALHRKGIAHSVEVWQQDKLVGGLYGVNVGSIFCGESMFSRTSNASKYAFISFYFHFLGYNGQLFDCQVLNHHTASLGAKEISRKNFSQMLYHWRDKQINSACWSPQLIDL